MGEKARPRVFEGWLEGQGGYGKVRLGGQKGRKWVKGSRDRYHPLTISILPRL